MNPSADTMRNEIERAMRHALAMYPTDHGARARFLIGTLAALLELDPTLARRFLATAASLCE